ncbi:activating signal cointegrator 1 complex subunit 2 homolog [Centruroides sculpturatus]|uniref:activating signal cointegrator 1 complex subunit 2 homolog n=1 Tax=Centruroides sculpturatus TaxID=218467 RepID=UPI000C6E7CF0|nr:activating signal cointegrator 1 complex subunit 2 homolog [Centruroides sculpturatus]
MVLTKVGEGIDRTVSLPGAPLKADYKSRRKMKCLISVGLVLPALAAVIGVVAWAVSADIVMGHARDSVVNSNQRLQDESLEDPVLQERSDNMYDGRLPVGGRVNQLLDNLHVESSSTAKTEVESPSYVMHMVIPEQKSTTTAPTKSTTTKPPLAVTDMNEFLSRIISASRESEVEDDDDEETTTVEEEEVIPTSKKPDVGRRTPQPKNGPKRSSDNFDDQGVRTYYPANNGGNYAPQQQQQQQQVQIQQQPVNPHKSYYNQHHLPQKHQPQPHFPSARPQQHHSPPPPPQQQQYAPPPPHLRPHHPPPNFEQSHGYIPKQASQQAVPYFHQPEQLPPQHPPPATIHKRNHGGYGQGYEAPKGVTITFGSNQGGYGGSDYHSYGGHHVEPFSVIKSLFLPFLPKPKVNLNGRVVFGVVLEKGVGLGGNKGEGGVSVGGYH